jgi:hypothetical protein
MGKGEGGGVGTGGYNLYSNMSMGTGKYIPQGYLILQFFLFCLCMLCLLGWHMNSQFPVSEVSKLMQIRV